MTLREELDPHPPRQSRASLGKLDLDKFIKIFDIPFAYSRVLISRS